MISAAAVEWVNFIVIVVGVAGGVASLGCAADRARRERERR